MTQIILPGNSAALPKAHGLAGNTAARTGAFHVGRWRVDPPARTVTDGAVRRRLSPRAMRLLETLAETPGEVVDRGTLLDAVWPGVTVTDESLTQAVAELRRALSDRTAVETVARAGYRLAATVLREVADTGRLFAAAGAEAFDFEAYRLCIEARMPVARGDHMAMEISESLTREAVARAPNFALARAEHALMSAQRGLYRAHESAGFADALDHAEAAVRLRPDLAHGYTALGYTFGALERWDEAKAAFARAVTLDPHDSDAHYWAGRTIYATGDFRVAAALGERAAALNPDCVRAPYLAARSAAVFDPRRGRWNAETCFRRIDARLAVDAGEDRARMARGPLLAMLGRTEEAVEALERDPADGSPLEFYSAAAWALAGETGRALECLERVIEGGWRHPAWLRAEPALGVFAGSARFARIARGIGAA